jgi:hypothetical protein
MKIMVYTANIGGYDKTPIHAFKKEGVDFLSINDEDRDLSNVKKARLAKTCPHLFFDVFKYDYVIWHDSNMCLKKDPSELCETVDNLAFLRHRGERKSILDEARICMSLRKGSKDEIQKQVDMYKEENIVPKFVYETGFNIRSYKKKPELVGIMELWWNEIEKYSSRDQISLPYILIKHDIPHQTMEHLNTAYMRNLINFRISHG